MKTNFFRITLLALPILSLVVWKYTGQQRVSESGDHRATLEKNESARRHREDTTGQQKDKSASQASSESEQLIDQIRVKGTWEYNLVGDLAEPFDKEKLLRLIDDPNRDERELKNHILRAAAEKDASFRLLLDREDLRTQPDIQLCILAYDYQVNGNPAALEQILTSFDRHIAEGGGTDSMQLKVLSFIEEWDITRDRISSYRLSGDGAGGDVLHAFWLRRRFLYPHHPDFPKDEKVFRQQIDGRPAASAGE